MPPNDVPDWTQVALMTESAIPNSPYVFPRDGLFHNVNGISLPQGSQWLVFGTANQPDITDLVVTGTTTSIEYAANQLTGMSPLLYVRVHPAIDPVVNISVQTSSAGGNATVGIAFGYAPALLDLDPLTPSPVFLQSASRTAIAIDAGLDTNHNRLGVSLSGAVAGQVKDGTPDWQAFARQNGAGGPASCTSAASGLLRAVAHAVVFTVAANANRVFTGRVWDGASGGTQIGSVVIGTNGAAAGPNSLSETLYLLKSTAGNALTFDFDFAAAAGEQQAITASGYFST